jgi:hypothetical protein
VVREQLREKMLSSGVAWRGVVWPGRDTMSALRLRGRDISMET